MTIEAIYNLAIQRTVWLKQFDTHEEYCQELDKFTKLSNLQEYVKDKDWFTLQNTSVKLDSDGVIIEAIKH